MIRKALFDSGLPKNLWSLAGEDCNKTYRNLYHDAAKYAPGFIWYETRAHISEFHVWGCYLEAKLPNDIIKKRGKLDERIERGYYMGTFCTNSIIKYWDPTEPEKVKYCTSAKFNDRVTYLPNGNLSPGSLMSGGEPKPKDTVLTDIKIADNPILPHPIEIKKIIFPAKGQEINVTIKQCEYHNLPYLSTSHPNSCFYKKLSPPLRHNAWILAIDNKEPITAKRAMENITNCQVSRQTKEVTIVLSKRDTVDKKTTIYQNWTAFEQMAPLIKNKNENKNDQEDSSKVPIEFTNRRQSSRIRNQQQQKHQGQIEIRQKPTSSKPVKNSFIPRRVSSRLRKNKNVPPKINKIIKAMIKPECPVNIGQALKSQYKPEWLEALFKCFDKMHNTGTLSRPFLRIKLPAKTLILNPRLSFEVRITDMDNFFNLKICFVPTDPR